MATLAVLVWTERAGDAAVTRSLRALSPLRDGDEVWLLRGGAHRGVAPDDAARHAATLAPVRTLATGPDEPPAVALNRAIEASRAEWCLFWHAASVAAPTALEGLRSLVLAAQRAAAGAVPPWPALLVGVAGHRLAAEPSPLAHFLAAREAACTADLREGDDVPADAVSAEHWAASRALLTSLGGLDPAFDRPTGAVDLARRAYAAGVPLRLGRALAARRAGAPRVAECVARWRSLGHDGVALLRKHGDPHAMDRVVARLGPYRRLLEGAAALAAQLDAVDQRLTAARRPHPAHVAGLQPSFANLYAVSVLEGVLRHPAGAARLAAPGQHAVPAAAPRRVRAGPRGTGPRRPPGAPHA